MLICFILRKSYDKSVLKKNNINKGIEVLVKITSS